MRVRRGLAADHLRVIVSGTGSLDPAASLFRCESSPVLVLISRRTPTVRVSKLREVATEVMAFGSRELDLPAALRWLRHCRGVKRLICEGGGELNDAMVRAGLVDELRVTICPLVFGGRSAPTISDGLGFPRLAQATGFRLRSLRRVGDEMFLRLAR
jgi:riboflavin-specific deaminase-like protein